MFLLGVPVHIHTLVLTICIFITSSVLCPEETSFITEVGEISWSSAAPGNVAESNARCEINSKLRVHLLFTLKD